MLPFVLLGQNTPDQRERLRQLQSLPYVSPPGAQESEGRTGVAAHRPEEAAPGLNIYATRFTNKAYIMTNEGKILHQWSAPDRSSWLDIEVLPDGGLLVLSAWDRARGKEFPAEKGFPSYVTRLSADSKIIWRQTLAAHHDIRRMPDGNFLTLLEVTRALPEVRRRGLVVDNAVAILSPSGEVIGRRSLYNLLHRGRKLRPAEALIGDAVDLFHTNSVERVEPGLAAAIRRSRGGRTRPLHESGTVLVCIRHQDLVAAFSWKTSRLLWTWGPGELEGPHAASVLPNGNVLIFDNGLVRQQSRIVEVDPATNDIVWEYTARHPKSFYSGTGGYVQRLANGNTLITDSWKYSVTEVTPDKRTVWKWINPERSFTYRVERREWSYFTPKFRSRLMR